MALTLKPLWRARFTYKTTTSIALGAYPVTTPPPAAGLVYPYPKVYAVSVGKAALIKSIILTNLHTSDLTITGIYTGLRSTEPAAPSDLVTGNPTVGNPIVLFNRIAPKDLRVPSGSQIVLDTEIVMAGINVTVNTTGPVITPHNDYLVFELPSVAAQIDNVMDCVVNGAERDQV